MIDPFEDFFRMPDEVYGSMEDEFIFGIYEPEDNLDEQPRRKKNEE